MIAANEAVMGGSEIITNVVDNDLIDFNELIIKCRTDKSSLEILYNTFKKGVFALAFSIVGMR